MNPSLTRRRFLQASAAGCLAGALPLVHPRYAFASGGAAAGETLVVVLLRGGCDGLSAVAPVHDPAYAAARPHTAVPAIVAPKLDDTFGLHPALTPLLGPWTDGNLALVPACGSTDPSRSHFRQQDILERGSADPSVATGWVARHLATKPGAAGALQSAAIVDGFPPSLHGAPGAIAVPGFTDVNVAGLDGDAFARREAALAALAGTDEFGAIATDAIAAVNATRQANPTALQPANGARYDGSVLGDRLRQVAQLVRAGVGLEAAVVEWAAWDMHVGMGTWQVGPLRSNLTSLANALAAFYVDTADHRDAVTTVVVTEFGRRVSENANMGTDHGHGGLAMVMGGGARGGLHGSWPGITPDVLDNGDVAVTTDVRDVLAEVVASRLGNPSVGQVFPGLDYRPLGVVDPRG